MLATEYRSGVPPAAACDDVFRDFSRHAAHALAPYLPANAFTHVSKAAQMAGVNTELL